MWYVMVSASPSRVQLGMSTFHDAHAARRRGRIPVSVCSTTRLTVYSKPLSAVALAGIRVRQQREALVGVGRHHEAVEPLVARRPC